MVSEPKGHTTPLPLERTDNPGAAQSAFTFRSIAIGTLAVIAICMLGTFNDRVVFNTYLIGSFFPLAMVLVLFGLVVVVNGLLRATSPRHAISTPELSVILLMTLLGCGIPCQGLFRFLLPMIIGPFNFGVSNAKFWNLFHSMDPARLALSPSLLHRRRPQPTRHQQFHRPGPAG